ncbi:30S ribosomal protein S17 [bacterium (Candidatus Gribaldobacteria) CG08_land_8_20_14_0_20_39_15]|uniref:Small ribosomal subunit protein uS17 n=1 Tax=bacterium (Candidatus Gribaldobacteria) CG08_land_8_20_14_0_20_39_15 TaxID=2014273 RepID=A0A2M6XUX5_9BACT|nr:MAG: 30S ribosomal protein S17 [bacterium (Candidatus Gribaldobacteria) CG08_land_8_20_14_0_20_39_15]
MRKTLRGTIISTKMQNTVVVKVNRLVAHLKYHKRFKVSKKYKAHVEGGDFKAGDSVIIESCRPISKDKKWRVLKKIEKGIKAIAEDTIK